ncbi:MAG: MFS transporter [Fimbriimonadaceae bacterium]|nr:MFS transporter [Fimbriimonadaceae bacterium]
MAADDRRFKQLYFLLFCPIALQNTFHTLYLKRVGLSDADLGQISALGSAFAIAAPLVIGYLADRHGHKRRWLAVCALLTAVVLPAHWLFRSLLAFLLLGSLTSLGRSAQIPLADALCLDNLHARGDQGAVNYSRLRKWGSIGFIVAATGFPLLLPPEGRSDPIGRLALVYLGMLLFGLLFAARAATIPEVAHLRGSGPTDRHVLAVLRLPGLKSLTALLLIGGAANMVYYLFLGLYLDDIGVGDRWKGACVSVGVVAETFFMIGGTWLLRRYGVRRLLLWGFAGRTLRLLLLGQPLPPWVVWTLVQPLHALAFGAVHIGTIAYLARTVPNSQRASGQTVVNSLVGGVGGVLGNLLAGHLSDASSAGRLAWLTSREGVYAAFWVGGLLHLGVQLLAWLTIREPAPQVSEQVVTAPSQHAAPAGVEEPTG